MGSTFARVVHWTTVLLLACILLIVVAGVLYYVDDTIYHRRQESVLVGAWAHYVAEALEAIKADKGLYPSDLAGLGSLRPYVDECIRNVVFSAHLRGVSLSEVRLQGGRRKPGEVVMELKGDKGTVEILAGGTVRTTANLAPAKELRHDWLVVR
jgi:hypothetical protein